MTLVLLHIFSGLLVYDAPGSFNIFLALHNIRRMYDLIISFMCCSSIAFPFSKIHTETHGRGCTERTFTIVHLSDSAKQGRMVAIDAFEWTLGQVL